ncbi:MAG: 8-amino-7-oxononanoate synthase [Endozoicomonadaceae bacterium]|nr:8-amino-7-oxononanoate synthase [Endozoicomonadaceae bacterium]
MNAFNLTSTLDEWDKKHLYRHRHILESHQGPVIQVDGKHYLNFCSNDYLGLASHPEVIATFQQAANLYGVGGGASHLVVGHHRLHHELEERLAEFTGRPSAVLFSSGYMANMGVITALLGKKDAIFEDRLNHASLLDAGRLSGARFHRYLHCNVNNLQERLLETTARRKMIVTDGVFSMDGNCAPLTELVQLAKQNHAWLMVDDAHGLGVLGETGAGSTEACQLSAEDVPVLMGTLGKALGTMGAFVAGSKALTETLIQFARTYMFTTALPPAVAAATLTSLKLVAQQSWRREKLTALITRFRKAAKASGLSLMPSLTAIQPLLTDKPEAAMAMHQALKSQGILVSAIRPPSVPTNACRLRITLSAAHTEAQVDRLIEALIYAHHHVIQEEVL